MTRAAAIVLLLAAIAVANGIGVSNPGAHRLSQTSAVSAAPQPTPTYVSELAPAVAVRPERPAVLPDTGTSSLSLPPWPGVAGIGLALAGALLIHASLTVQRRTSR